MSMADNDELRERIENDVPEFDTREKLETDVEEICWGKNNDRYLANLRYLSSAGIRVNEGNVMANHEGHVLMTVIMHLLDRQASITERHWMEICGANANANLELKRQIDRLKAERDEWKTKCDTREVAYKQADAQRKIYSEQIDELFAERDMYRDKLGRAIDAAQAITRVMDE